jgi:hypothetical protein
MYHRKLDIGGERERVIMFHNRKNIERNGIHIIPC